MQTFADYESNDRPWYINEISLALRRTYGHSWWCVKVKSLPEVSSKTLSISITIRA